MSKRERSRLSRHSRSVARAVGLTTLVVAPALAQERGDGRAGAPEEETQSSTSIGLAPGAPQSGTLPGGATPGGIPTGPGDWRFDFHGFLRMPLSIGIGDRDNCRYGAGAQLPGLPACDEAATTEQSPTALHTPALVPGEYGSFAWTGISPGPWVQLNFSYGNSIVTGNVIIAAKTATGGSLFFDPTQQLGINDVFLTFRVPTGSRSRIEWNVGTFSNRYGLLGEYDEGQYATPIIARIEGAGETLSAAYELGDVTLLAEHGFQGHLDHAPVEIIPAHWNDYSDPNVGSSFATHLHAGAAYKGFKLLAHYITAFSQDDRANQNLQPDGHINVFGADAAFSAGPYGHAALAFSRLSAEDSRSVGGVIRYLNTNGGPGLMRNYFGYGGNGTGNLTTLALQYDLSIASLVYNPKPFYGDGPDVKLSAFGMYTKVETDPAELDPVYGTTHNVVLDGASRYKLGGEATYSMLSWLAVSARFDRVAPTSKDSAQSYSVISPRLILRSDFNAHDQVVLQYSRWFNGEHTLAFPAPNPRDLRPQAPDKHMISLSANMWW